MGHRIMKLSDLCCLYITTLENTSHPNPHDRGENLKLMYELFSQQLSFYTIDDKVQFQTYLVHHSMSIIDAAIKFTYKLGTTDMVTAVALYLDKIIMEAFENSGTLAHWHTGTLAHWHTGTLAHWHTGTLAHCHTATLPHLHTATLPQSPTDDYLKGTDVIPDQLDKILYYLILGKEQTKRTKVTRLE